jgi:hypothetical protein
MEAPPERRFRVEVGPENGPKYLNIHLLLTEIQQRPRGGPVVRSLVLYIWIRIDLGFGVILFNTTASGILIPIVLVVLLVAWFWAMYRLLLFLLVVAMVWRRWILIY